MSFYLSKILWLVINPFNILILLQFIIIFFLYIKKNKLNYFLIPIFFTLLFCFGVLPLGKFLIYNLEKNYHNSFVFPDKVDGILILGGATNPFLSDEFNQINLNGSAERLIESITLINKYRYAKVIFSGGSGYINDPEMDHARIAKQFFIKMGINTNKIFFENQSRNTYENILFSKKIAKPKNEENWIVITSAFHMNRAIFIGEKIDWILKPYAVDFTQSKKLRFKPSLKILNNLNQIQKGSHEWIGLIAYYLMGRTSRIL